MHSTSKTKMMTLLASNISAHSNYLTLSTVQNIFFKLMFISYLTYEMLYLRSRYENATSNLCWMFCALLGVLCN